MNNALDRRRFLRTSVLGMGVLAVCFPAIGASAKSANEKIILGVMGTNGRGSDLAKSFGALPGVEFAYVCDVDERAIAKAIQVIAAKQTNTPKGVKDFRRVLEDPAVDGLVVAAPDHWHAPATILACSAGKHVYVEKPVSHNPREGELAVAAARKDQRVVQAGTQRRSMPAVKEAITKVQGGEIGRVLFARGWYNSMRPSIGHGEAAPVPGWLDYALWQGPAPAREYRSNFLHYNWHWFWHWGTGEIGNNGIHALDICRWGLQVDYPLRVSCGGGKYRWDDDQETPDTQVVTYDFGDKSITWEGRSWHPRGFEESAFGIGFYGEKGTLIIDQKGYRVFDMQDKLVYRSNGSSSEAPHLQNFLDCVRSGKRPNADIEEGHKSTLLCHLGNIAFRTGHTLHLDAATHEIKEDPAATALWSREYQPGWEPKV